MSFQQVAVASLVMIVAGPSEALADDGGFPQLVRPSLAIEPAEPNAGSAPASAEGAEDKSGTDPTKFLRTVRMTSEYLRLPSENHVVTTAFAFVQPFNDATMNFRLKVPTVYTDAAGTGEFGVGDLSLRWNWLPIITPKFGLLIGTEVIGDTASDDALGRGKWTVGPLVTYALFLNKNTIFAPSYQHNVSVAGDSGRADVNESVFDFYLVFTADDKRSWITIDPQLVIDWERDERTPFVVKTQFGWRIGSLWGGALNASIQPAIGIGNDRPYDWAIEFGVNVTGF